MKEWMYQIMLSMRYCKYSQKLYWILEDLGIRIMISRIFNFFSALNASRHPTEQMAQAKAYFHQHQEEVQAVMDLLSDERSKKIYRTMIQYRCTMRHRDLPPHSSYRTQYFGNSYFSYHKGELFVDCGAFDGDTVRSFVKLMKKKKIDKYNVVCFEPDEKNYAALKRNYPTAICFPYGVYSHEDVLSFQIGLGSANSIAYKDGADTISIRVKRIDDIKECQDATFIKMDIEGSEQMALLGAQATISQNKPKLAICIYHSDEDMIKIPLMVHGMNPDYKLYIGHHSNSLGETVLYATM